MENLELNEGFDINYKFNIFNENHNLSLQRIDSSLVWLDRIMDGEITPTANPVVDEAVFSVYPNIVTSHAEVVFHRKIQEGSTLLVSDNTGRIIAEYKNLAPAPGEMFKISTDQWLSGTYWIILRNDKEVYKKQVVKM